MGHSSAEPPPPPPVIKQPEYISSPGYWEWYWRELPLWQAQHKERSRVRSLVVIVAILIALLTSAAAILAHKFGLTF